MYGDKFGEFIYGYWDLRINGGPGEWQNLFAISRFFFIHYTFYCYWGKENYSLYRGLRYTEVCYIVYEEYPTVLLYKFPTHLKARALFNFPLVRIKGFLGSSGI